MSTTRKNRKNRKWFLLIFFAFLVSFSTYSFAVAKTTFSASQMKERQAKMNELHLAIADLDTQYYALLEEIDKKRADEFHLSPVQSVAYADILLNGE